MYETIIEVTWKYDQLQAAGKIISMDQALTGSDGAKDTIIQIAEDFEKQYQIEWDSSDLDYILEIEKYAEQSLIIGFGTPEAKRTLAQELWQTLGDIPIGNNDEILELWRDFPAGTSRFDIWSWFEEQFNISVAIDLMHLESGF